MSTGQKQTNHGWWRKQNKTNFLRAPLLPYLALLTLFGFWLVFVYLHSVDSILQDGSNSIDPLSYLHRSRFYEGDILDHKYILTLPKALSESRLKSVGKTVDSPAARASLQATASFYTHWVSSIKQERPIVLNTAWSYQIQPDGSWVLSVDRTASMHHSEIRP